MQVNNRRDQRHTVSAEYSICWRDGAGQMKSAAAQSQDVSNSGIRVRASVELAPGTTVSIECKDNLLRGYFTVRHCTLRDTIYQRRRFQTAMLVTTAIGRLA